MARGCQKAHVQSAIEHRSLPYSHLSSQHQSDTVKTTGNTPQNSNRDKKKRQLDTLNRSL
jgi:hypothetical protein